MKKLRKTIKLCILRGTQGVRPPAAEGSLLPAGIRGAGIFECIVVYCCVCVHVFSCVYISTYLYFYAYLHMYSHSALSFVFILCLSACWYYGGQRFWHLSVLLCICLHLYVYFTKGLCLYVCLKYIYEVVGVFVYVLSVNQSDCVFRFNMFVVVFYLLCTC